MKGYILVSEAARRMRTSRQKVCRELQIGRLRGIKSHNQWYVAIASVEAAIRVLGIGEKPDLELQATINRLTAEEWERTRPGVERSWENDPFPENGRHKELSGV